MNPPSPLVALGDEDNNHKLCSAFGGTLTRLLTHKRRCATA
nr:MAG TPA: hypothetical protein [Caudoviricetes sp.]